jgi:hypothetical protein
VVANHAEVDHSGGLDLDGHLRQYRHRQRRQLRNFKRSRHGHLFGDCLGGGVPGPRQKRCKCDSVSNDCKQKVLLRILMQWLTFSNLVFLSIFLHLLHIVRSTSMARY